MLRSATSSIKTEITPETHKQKNHWDITQLIKGNWHGYRDFKIPVSDSINIYHVNHLAYLMVLSSILSTNTVLSTLLLLLSCSVMSNSFVTPWTVAHQAPLSMGFPRQEHWNGLPFPSEEKQGDHVEEKDIHKIWNQRDWSQNPLINHHLLVIWL